MIYNSDVKNIVGQYIEFCKIFDEHLKLYPDNKMLAIKKTLEICTEKGLLLDFISHYESEVNTLMEDFIFNERDYIKLEYADNDFAFVPIEQVNLIQRYIGNEGEKPRLDRIGSKSWENRKSKVR